MLTTHLRKDFSGQRFGLLKIISLSKVSEDKRNSFWNCQCDCGNTLIINGKNLYGGTKSCGCLKNSLLQGDKIICKVCHIEKNRNKFYAKSSRVTTKHNICKECLITNNLKSKQERNFKNKTLVLNHYSNGTMKCECCGESHEEFLTIDHINGGGNKHRAEIAAKSRSGGGSVTYKWLIKNKFPSGFRVLCSNCNTSYGRLGYCPHKCPESKKHPQGRVKYPDIQVAS
jgi:hypothetical protein